MARRLIKMSTPERALLIAVRLAGGALALGWLFAGHLSMAQDDLAEQRVQYDDDSPKTILELQRFRSVTHAAVQRADGVSGTAELINLGRTLRLPRQKPESRRCLARCGKYGYRRSVSTYSLAPRMQRVFRIGNTGQQHENRQRS